MDDPQQCGGDGQMIARRAEGLRLVGNGQMIGVPSAYDWPVSCRIKDGIFCGQTSFSMGRGRGDGHGLLKGYRAMIEKLL